MDILDIVRALTMGSTNSLHYNARPRTGASHTNIQFPFTSVSFVRICDACTFGGHRPSDKDEVSNSNGGLTPSQADKCHGYVA